jgi:hypothetical protein
MRIRQCEISVARVNISDVSPERSSRTDSERSTSEYSESNPLPPASVCAMGVCARA